MYGNPTFDCAGAQIHAVCRQLATVVTVDGTIDGANIERVTALARRFVLTEKPFVLDLSGVISISSHGISLLNEIEQHCFQAGVEWAVITGETVARMLRTSPASFPVAGSVPDALHQFADSLDERRRLLPLLTKKTA